MGSVRSTEMVEAENLDHVPNVTDFQDVRGQDVTGKKTAFHLLSASHTLEQSYHADDRGQ